MEGSGASQDTLQSVRKDLQLCQKKLERLTNIVETLLQMQAESCNSLGDKYTSLWQDISEAWNTAHQSSTRADEFGLPMDP